MSSHHVVVWLDHVEAHVIHFTVDTSEKEVVKTHATRPHLHVRSGTLGSGRAAENTRYFDDIVTAVHDSTEILLIGPGSGKDEFMKYIAQHHKPVAAKIVAVLTDDHPSDAQLLAFARKYFVRADRMNADPVAAGRHG